MHRHSIHINAHSTQICTHIYCTLKHTAHRSTHILRAHRHSPMHTLHGHADAQYTDMYTYSTHTLHTFMHSHCTQKCTHYIHDAHTHTSLLSLARARSCAFFRALQSAQLLHWGFPLTNGQSTQELEGLFHYRSCMP